MMMNRTGSGCLDGTGTIGITRSKMIRKGHEPYRATKLWLEALAIFRRGIPLGKHRKQWKTYENCFVASEAITWFQAQLQQTFRTSGASQKKQLEQNKTAGITRQQTHQLLQKMYKAGVFTTVNNESVSVLLNSSSTYSGSVGFIKETDFKDNAQLYRLIGSFETDSPGTKDKIGTLTETPKRKVATPAPIESNSFNNYSVIIRPLSLGKINSIWEEHFIQRFTFVVGSDVIRTLYSQPNLIPGHWIAHNMTQISKHGIAISSKSDDDLPKWLIQAMKCLATWPNHQLNEQPNYPGFENDVFKLIVDYFNKTCCNGKGPLLTFGLYDAFITSFIHAELFDFNTRLYSVKINASSGQTPTTNTFSKHFNNSRHSNRWNTICSPNTGYQEEQYPFNASESIENLLFDILTPQTRATQRKFGLVKPKRIVLDPASSGIENEKNVPKPMPAQSYNISRYSSTLANNAGNPSCYYYETAFTNDSSPLTRVISKTELQTSFGSVLPSNIISKNHNFVGTSGVSDEAYAYENPNLELSGSELIHHPKYSKLVRNSAGLLLANSSELSSTSTSTSYSFCEYSSGNSMSSNSNGKSFDGSVGLNTAAAPRFLLSHAACPTAVRAKMDYSVGSQGRLYGKCRSYSAIDLSDSYRDRSPYTFNREGRHGCSSVVTNYDNGNNSTMTDLHGESARRTLDFYYGADACIPGLMTNEGKKLAIQSFRLLTLLLPPILRRHLQLLLRCMAKMARNDKLMLDVAMTTRAIVVNAFFKNILYCADNNQFDELLALRIVTFMMDNDSEIFFLQDEMTLVDSVQKMISEQQIIKVANEVARSSPKVGFLTPIAKDEKKATPKKNVVVAKDLSNPENKENHVQYCSRITLDEYEDQRLLGGGGTAPSLRLLLDAILEDSRMTKKVKKERLDQFVKEYPHIFHEKFGDAYPEDVLKSYTDNDSFSNSTEQSSEKAKQPKKLNPFNRLFRNLRL